ncbi:hypothetical protein ES708_27657 [subsurface metagenome]
MKTLTGRQEPAVFPSSLDKEDTSARRRSKRCYHRVISGLEKGGQVRLITLTTAHQSQNKAFQKHFRQLRMRLFRRCLLVDYIRCPEYTETGLRHEHILFRGSYIEQAYLSYLWQEIHGAEVVDIRRTWGKRRLASYLASYMAKAPAGRYCYSYGWVWQGFVKSWKFLRKASTWCCQDYWSLLTTWRRFVKLGVKPDSNLGVMWLNKLWGVSYAQANQILVEVQ